MSGSRDARKTVFSLLDLPVSGAVSKDLNYPYHVWLTQITWSTSLNVNFKSLFVKILAASAKPKREWSVKTVRSPIVLACRMASWHKLLKLAWPCTISICSLMMIFRKIGKNEKTVGRVDSRYMTKKGT